MWNGGLVAATEALWRVCCTALTAVNPAAGRRPSAGELLLQPLVQEATAHGLRQAIATINSTTPVPKERRESEQSGESLENTMVL